MAGKPMRRMNIKLIEDSGGEETLLALIRSGYTVKRCAERLGVSQSVLQMWLTDTPERRERVALARAEAAAHLADETLEIADAATNDDERVARLRIDTRKWLASKWAPNTYGDQRGPVVQVNINDMHLRAVRSAETIEVEEATIVKPDNGR